MSDVRPVPDAERPRDDHRPRAAHPPVLLVIGYGNPLREDDGVACPVSTTCTCLARHHTGGQLDEVTIGGFESLGGQLAFLPCDLHDSLHLFARVLGAVRTRLLGQVRSILHHGFSFAEHPTEHPHAIVEQRAVGGVVDVGFDDRAVNAQLAALRHLELAGQIDDMVEQAV